MLGTGTPPVLPAAMKAPPVGEAEATGTLCGFARPGGAAMKAPPVGEAEAWCKTAEDVSRYMTPQ